MAIEDVYDKKAKKTYVYEVEYQYDPAIKNTRKKRKILGHRDPETGEIKPNRPRKKKVAVTANDKDVLEMAKTIERKHYGATYYLHSVAKNEKIIDALKESFPEHYEQLLQLAYYLVMAPTNSMRQFESWAKSHYLPYDSANKLTSQRISDLFKQVDEEGIQRFFDLRMKQTKAKEYLYYDTTSISSYSKTLPYAQYGYNKEDDKLPQINLGVIFSEQTRLPIMYRYLSGNIPDNKTITWLLSLLDNMSKESIKLVMDRGFYSQDNIKALIHHGIGFVMGAKSNLSYVKAAIETVRDEISDVENYSTVYKLAGKRVKTDYFKPESGNGHYPIYVYAYYNRDQAVDQEHQWNVELQKRYKELQSGELKVGFEKDYKNYFTQIEEDGQITYEYNRENIAAHKRNFGYFILISSYKKDIWELLSLYRNKDLIEDAFHNLKDRLNMRRLRVSSESGLEGKLFVQFVALILQSYIKHALDETELNEEYTQADFLASLNRIDILTHTKYGATIGETTIAQKLLYSKTGISYPE
ncbi:transposase [Aerococcaceae bacterium DSM 111176]|nr:transposase [Aerococcaceae bacterium DSM 111176]